MNCLLTFLVVASLAVIAASAFIEQEEDSEVADIATNEALAESEADPEARRRGSRCNNGKCQKKAKKSKKAKKAKKAKKHKKHKSNKNAKGGKRTTKVEGKCSRQSAQCGTDAVAVLKYEGSAVDNFNTQRKRALKFKEIVDKKKGKKANFDNSSSSMLDALGGDTAAPVCKKAALRITRNSADKAIANYGILKNCSANIETNCGVPANTINETALDACNATMMAIKTKNAECCAAADAAAKCTCFAASAALMATAKASGCSKIGKDANNAMKKQKKSCTESFGECNTAEAEATGLINICLGGDDVTAAAAAAGTTAAAAGTTAAAAGPTMAAATATMAANATAAGR